MRAARFLLAHLLLCSLHCSHDYKLVQRDISSHCLHLLSLTSSTSLDITDTARSFSTTSTTVQDGQTTFGRVSFGVNKD